MGFLNKQKNTQDGLSQNKEVKYSAFFKKAGVLMTRYFDALVAVLVIIIFLLGVSFVISPKYKAIVKAEKYSQEDLEEEINNLNTYLNKLLEYKKTYQQLSDISIDRVKKVVPEDDHLEDLFARLESITKRQGVVIKMMTLTDLSDNDVDKKRGSNNSTLHKVEIALSISGVDYYGLKKILSVFENNLRLMDVQGVKFDLDAKTADFSIITYFLGE